MKSTDQRFSSKDLIDGEMSWNPKDRYARIENEWKEARYIFVNYNRIKSRHLRLSSNHRRSIDVRVFLQLSELSGDHQRSAFNGNFT